MLIVFEIIVFGLICLIIGFFKYFFKNGCNFFGMVVEKMSICNFFGKWFVIWLIFVKKFIFNVMFVLLIIKVKVVCIFKVCLFIIFKICFGVLIIIWGCWCFNLFNWCCLFVLLIKFDIWIFGWLKWVSCCVFW